MPRISFAPTLVTGVSRQLKNEEHWTLYYFEQHAAQCVTCYDPATVQKEGRRLCSEGRELACNIAALLFHMKNGHIYVTEDEQVLRIEMPAKYQHVSGLFKAIEASRNGILQRPRSMDAHYPVRPRVSMMHYPVTTQHAGHAAADYEYDYYPSARGGHYMAPTRSSSPRRSPTASPQFTQRWSRESRGSSRGSRGSLYDDDQLVQRQRDSRERLVHYGIATPLFRQSRTWG